MQPRQAERPSQWFASPPKACSAVTRPSCNFGFGRASTGWCDLAASAAIGAAFAGGQAVRCSTCPIASGFTTLLKSSGGNSSASVCWDWLTDVVDGSAYG